MPRYLLFAAVLFCMLFSAGCKDNKFTMMNRQEDLRERAELYHDRYAWRDFETASFMVVPDSRRDFLRFTEPLQRGYTVEDHSIQLIKVSPDGDRAAVVVKRSFIKTPSITLQSESVTQEWVFQEGAWYLSGPPY